MEWGGRFGNFLLHTHKGIDLGSVIDTESLHLKKLAGDFLLIPDFLYNI